jgi:three-Cys-motif partner protein
MAASDPRQGGLFADLPPPLGKRPQFRHHDRPLWTESKAKLIQRYLYYFVMVTKHGAYIDGFAAPQDHANPESWAAKLVLESKPEYLREFWLCDISTKGVAALEAMVATLDKGRGRSIHIVPGDFNQTVNAVLASSKIKEKTASFCLLDQRTFECHWSTVTTIARHKMSGNKIELFYFFPSGWFGRAFAGTKKIESIERWWGRADWRELRRMNTWSRAFMAAQRLKDEFGYAYAYPFPIYDRSKRRRLMYHMIHASDHIDAPSLMWRAYRNATKPLEPADEVQMELRLSGGTGIRPAPS